MPENHDSTLRFNQLGSLSKLATFPKTKNQSMTLKTLDSTKMSFFVGVFLACLFFFRVLPTHISIRSNIFNFGKLPHDIGFAKECQGKNTLEIQRVSGSCLASCEAETCFFPVGQAMGIQSMEYLRWEHPKRGNFVRMGRWEDEMRQKSILSPPKRLEIQSIPKAVIGLSYYNSPSLLTTPICSIVIHTLI